MCNGFLGYRVCARLRLIDYSVLCCVVLSRLTGCWMYMGRIGRKGGGAGGLVRYARRVKARRLRRRYVLVLGTVRGWWLKLVDNR